MTSNPQDPTSHASSETKPTPVGTWSDEHTAEDKPLSPEEERGISAARADKYDPTAISPAPWSQDQANQPQDQAEPQGGQLNPPAHTTHDKTQPLTDLTLASRILLDDKAPIDPIPKLLNFTLALLVPIGVLTVLLVSNFQLSSIFIAVGMLACTIPSVMRYPYRMRAWLTAPIALNIAFIAAVWRHYIGPYFPGGELVLLSTFLCSSLLFRAYYRTAPLGRALVAVGVGTFAIWTTYSLMSHSELSADYPSWVYWINPTLWIVLALVLLLSLLAFMGPETSGACRHWAGGLMGWLLLLCIGQSAIAWNDPALSTQNVNLALSLSTAVMVCTAIASVAGFQLLAATAGKRVRASIAYG